jgi:hypothetical protein
MLHLVGCTLEIKYASLIIHVIFVLFERIDIDYKSKLLLYHLKSC